jgi:gliding motility-associated-like protein
MHTLKYRWIIVFGLLLGSFSLFATHNRAGEITYEQIGDLTIRITIKTYTKATSPVDRDSLVVIWGDGTFSSVPRINGSGDGELIAPDIKLNLYSGIHTYPGRSTYTLSFMDHNRTGGIQNVNWPNSVDVPIYVATTLTFFNPQFQGYNNSAILLQPPIDEACLHQRFIHNPNAYDPDGDSLAFELGIPLSDKDLEVPIYEFPDEVAPGPNNNVYFDEKTGEFIWDAPQRAGEYSIAIKIKEYRNGVLINTIIRDMQIHVVECDNRPPVVNAPKKLCVIAGEEIDIDVVVDDPDEGQRVRLFAFGGPLILDYKPATFTTESGYHFPPHPGNFRWKTECEHISPTDYSVVFKGEDDYFQSPMEIAGLVDLKTLLIHVSGPPPINLQADGNRTSISLHWDKPYACDTALANYFRGFTIWRKRAPEFFTIDSCGVDLSDYGYEIVAYNQQQFDDDGYFYVDEEVEKGTTYCYRITAEFALVSPGGNPYNRVQSLPSVEVCQQIRRDVPLITHVTVDNTDNSSGQITVRWEPPLADDLDTLENPGPYRYQLLRASGIGNMSFQEVGGASFNSTTFSGLSAYSQYTDQNLNTSGEAYNYAILFFVGGSSTPYDMSQDASSVYLSINPSDRKNILKWEAKVPWEIYQSIIYRRNDVSGLFDTVGITTKQEFTDTGLENEKSYCYYIETLGTFGIADLPSPLINLSQIKCGTPIDTFPPCTPVLNVSTNCDELGPGEPIDELISSLSWHFNNGECTDSSDIVQYQVFYISNLSKDTILLAEINDIEEKRLEHLITDQAGGCYFVIATDRSGNVSERSEIICAELCPDYELPNVFTPNNDNANDIFRPYPYKFITQIDMKIATRWGNVVFETNDPEINWDGRDLNGNELGEDTYYYTCDVFGTGPGGELIKVKELKGHITLIRD